MAFASAKTHKHSSGAHKRGEHHLHASSSSSSHDQDGDDDYTPFSPFSGASTHANDDDDDNDDDDRANAESSHDPEAILFRDAAAFMSNYHASDYDEFYDDDMDNVPLRRSSRPRTPVEPFPIGHSSSDDEDSRNSDESDTRPTKRSRSKQKKRMDRRIRNADPDVRRFAFYNTEFELDCNEPHSSALDVDYSLPCRLCNFHADPDIDEYGINTNKMEQIMRCINQQASRCTTQGIASFAHMLYMQEILDKAPKGAKVQIFTEGEWYRHLNTCDIDSGRIVAAMSREYGELSQKMTKCAMRRNADTGEEYPDCKVLKEKREIDKMRLLLLKQKDDIMNSRPANGRNSSLSGGGIGAVRAPLKRFR